MTGDRQMFPVQTTSTRTRRASQSSRARTTALVLLTVIAVVVLAGVVWLGLGARTVVQASQRAQGEVALAREAYSARDLAAGATHVAMAQRELDSARAASSGPVWAVAGTVPFVGDEVRAVAAVAAASAGLLDALAPVAELAGAGGTESPVRRVVLDDALPAHLALAHDRAVEARQLADELSGWDLHPRTQEQVGSFGDRVAQVEPALGQGVAHAGLLRRVLGAETPQELLVVVQTPAEVRSLGGLAGLVLVLRADGGELEVVSTYSGSTSPVSDQPVLSTPELQQHYAVLGDRAGRYPANATMVPDAALAASLLAEHHRLRAGDTPDAVVLLDMRLLVGLLAATGPVTLADGQQLTDENVHALLQHEVYDRLEDPQAQDAFFAAAAAGVFGALSAERTDSVAVARALAEGAAADRLVLWSPDPATQGLVEEVGLDGDLLGDPAAVGLFLNDGTGAKMQYFLTSDVSVLSRDGGSTVRLVLSSTAPAGDDLPDYVVGMHEHIGLARGEQRVQVALYGPVGDGPSAWRVDGVSTGAGAGVVGARGVGVLSVDLAPAQTVVVEIDLAAQADETTASLVTTPGVRTTTD